MTSLPEVVMVALLLIELVQSQAGVLQEYCEDETFRAECGDGSMVVMEEARYGRMRTGGCLLSDYGHENCHSDILREFDAWCSGRKSCEVKVRDLVVDGNNPCPKDLRSYLEAKWTCTPVYWPQVQRCHGSSPVVMQSQSGFLSNYVTEETGCGSIDSPWVIQASPGQRINLTLYDFGAAVLPAAERQELHVCQVVAVIKEEGRRSGETLCGGKQRITKVYRSVTEQLEVRFLLKKIREQETEGDQDRQKYAAIHYQVTGCADIPSTDDMWFKRTSGGGTVGCKATSDEWDLKCNGLEWQEDLPSCHPGSPRTSNVVMKSIVNLPHGVSIAVILAIALVIGAIVLSVGIVCIKRRRMQQRRDPLTPPPPAKGAAHPDYCPASYPAHYTDTQQQGGAGAGGEYTGGGGTQNYYRTWDPQRDAQIQQQQQRHNQAVANGGVGTLPGHAILPQFDRGRDDSPPRYVEHIYESPKSVRRDYQMRGPDNMKYYELDPGAMDRGRAASGPEVPQPRQQ